MYQIRILFPEEWKNNWSLICCVLTDPVEDLKESVSASSGGGFKRSMSLTASGETVLDRVQGTVIETLTIDKKSTPNSHQSSGWGDTQKGFCITVWRIPVCSFSTSILQNGSLSGNQLPPQRVSVCLLCISPMSFVQPSCHAFCQRTLIWTYQPSGPMPNALWEVPTWNEWLTLNE